MPTPPSNPPDSHQRAAIREHLACLPAEAPIHAIVASPEHEARLVAYERENNQAIAAQENYKRLARRAIRYTLIATIAAALVLLPLEQSLPVWARSALGWAQTLANGFAILVVWKIAGGEFIRTWLRSRAEAERLRGEIFFGLLDAPPPAGADPKRLLREKLDLVMAAHVDYQRGYFKSTTRKNEDGLARLERWRMLGTAVLLLAAIVGGLVLAKNAYGHFGDFGFAPMWMLGRLAEVMAPAEPVRLQLALNTFASAIIAFAGMRALIEQHERNVGLYRETAWGLDVLRNDRLAAAMAAAEQGDEATVRSFVAEAQRILEADHMAWGLGRPISDPRRPQSARSFGDAVTVIDVGLRARLYGVVWWAARLVALFAFMVFITIYAVAVQPMDYEVQTPVWLVVQPIVLAGMLVVARAVGRPLKTGNVVLLVLLAVFALAMTEILANLLRYPEMIEDWSIRYPDPRFHQWTQAVGGPVTFFLGWIAPATALLVAGALLAIVLRFWRLPALRMSLRSSARRVRAAVARSGGAPGLVARLRLWRRAGWAYGAAALVVVLLPGLLPGREREIPIATGVGTWLPDLLARALTFVNDRFLAVALAFAMALVLWRLAMQRFWPDASLVLERDERPPVVLLRSFMDDAAVVRPTALWRKALHIVAWPLRKAFASLAGPTHRPNGRVAKIARKALLTLTALSRRRIEEVAARSLADCGPFVAVDDPRIDTPELGAFRARLDGGTWREHVRGWIAEARMLVVVAGTTDGLRCEMRMAAKAGALPRTIVLLPPGMPEIANTRWQTLTDVLQSLPEAANWQRALAEVRPERALAVCFLDDGKIIAVNGRPTREADWELALRIGQGVVIRSAVPRAEPSPPAASGTPPPPLPTAPS